MNYEEIERKFPDFKKDDHILVKACQEFIVYLDECMDVEWETDDDLHKDSNTGRDTNRILNLASSIECIPNEHLESKTRKLFKRLIGEGIASSLEGHYESANATLEKAEEFVTKRNLEISRYWYLQSIGLSTFIFALAGLTGWLCRNFLIEQFGEAFLYIVLTGICGTLGALFSVGTRLGSFELDGTAARKHHYMEGVFRVVCAFIAGVLIGACIQAGIVVPIFSTASKTKVAMIIGGIIAGTSERLVPSIIEKVGNNNSESYSNSSTTEKNNEKNCPDNN